MSNRNEKTYALFSTPANKKIISELEKSGNQIFRFPPLEIEALIPDERLIAVLKNLDAVDWIIFPDVLSVDFFLQILEKYEIDLFEMDSVQVCAFGESVADRLRFVQLHADVIPTSISPTNIFIALSDFIGKELSNLKFLLPKELSSKYKIEKKLVENGTILVELPIYRATISRNQEITRLKALFRGGAIDEFIISSPVDLIALKIYFDREPLEITFSDAGVSATDKSAFRALCEHNLKANYFRPETKKS